MTWMSDESKANEMILQNALRRATTAQRNMNEAGAKVGALPQTELPLSLTSSIPKRMWWDVHAKLGEQTPTPEKATPVQGPPEAQAEEALPDTFELYRAGFNKRGEKVLTKEQVADLKSRGWSDNAIEKFREAIK